MDQSQRQTKRLALATCRTDGGTQARVALHAETVEDYAAALTFGATFPPIVAFYDGAAYWVADGFHRLEAARRAQLARISVEVRMGTQRDALLYAVGANATHGLRRSNADKRRAVSLLLEDSKWRRWSDREIARRCAVNHEMVGSLRSSLADSASDNGRTYTTKHGTVSTMDTERIGHGNGTPAPPMAVHFSSESPEHYTPPEIVAIARAVLGEIDLDPCSDPGHTVPAARHFTRDDDGLAQPWAGRVYMNPPYGREIDAWIEKLCTEHEAGNVTEAIALLPARTDTQWFKRLRDHVCCLIEGRLTFIGNDDPAPFPSMLVYLGDELGNFYEATLELGDVWQRIERGVHFGE